MEPEPAEVKMTSLIFDISKAFLGEAVYYELNECLGGHESKNFAIMEDITFSQKQTRQFDAVIDTVGHESAPVCKSVCVPQGLLERVYELKKN